VDVSLFLMLMKNIVEVANYFKLHQQLLIESKLVTE